MLGIAFEGCACRAAFHAGVAAALAEAGLPVAMTAGASSGSLCAAAWAAGRAAELPSILRSLGGRSIVSLQRALWNRSIFDMSHIVRNLLEERLGAFDLRAHSVEALISVTCLRGLRPLVVSSREEPDLVPVLLGSCFLPVLYGRVVRHRGEILVDGGITDNLPIEALAARGCDEVIAVIAAADGTALKRPLRPRLRLGYGPDEPRRPRHIGGARVHVIHPRKPLAIRAWDLDTDRIAGALDEGYAAGREFLGP
ncbi:MAG TPA: patatin-like phospholipase family protein [Polyangia bacterium]|jgi:NTE family protein|nr:patatin-like phospholipase family protein [Polyangia bacterium]